MLWSKLNLGFLAPTPATLNAVKLCLRPAWVPAGQYLFLVLKDVQIMTPFMTSLPDSVGCVDRFGHWLESWSKYSP